jgi:ABC-2 type transport system ATP-binding protein
MANVAIRINDLTRDFSSVRALDGLSIEIPEGIIFGFLGPNGAGKTTTINILLGLLEPTSGIVEVLGLNTRTRADDIRSHTGALLEYPGLYEQLSAEDNLEFYGRIWHLADVNRRERIKELLTQIGLWERRKEKVVKWSKGMKQRLALARALMHQPSLLILDEPTAGLDVMGATAIRNDLANLANNKGVSIFMATHNMAEAEKLCHQVAIIRQGKLLATGNPNELRKQTGGLQVEVIGTGFSEDLVNVIRAQPEVSTVERSKNRVVIQFTKEIDTAPLVNLLVNKGVQVEEVSKVKASLEDVFLTLMEEEK